MSVRAKFYVSKIEHGGSNTTSVGLKPVMAKWNAETRSYEESENKEFWDATPSGDISMTIQNHSAAEFFKANLGKEVYVDFTLANA